MNIEQGKISDFQLFLLITGFIDLFCIESGQTYHVVGDTVRFNIYRSFGICSHHSGDYRISFHGGIL